ncbi:MAG: CinA family protein [Candidatus Margulisiibacteriota bacterium]|nr:CinA family protein [Candidatus Margulisiibacteriota bacterium]MBU2546740.1 CinA family protein [Gammaproteobacteria bacterium]
MGEEIKKQEVRLEDFYSKMLSTIGKITDDEIASTLKESHKTLSVAESVTGGMVCGRLTNIAGSSEYFMGGLVCYHNRIKVTELGIAGSLIAKEGPASKSVALAMADNIRKRFKTDIGLATTGCAGPSPLPPAPVGQVFLAIATPSGNEAKELFLQGTRAEIREKATQAALGLLWIHLGGEI